jgi:hypothetical protein
VTKIIFLAFSTKVPQNTEEEFGINGKVGTEIGTGLLESVPLNQ